MSDRAVLDTAREAPQRLAVSTDTRTIDALWLGVLQRLFGRVTHELNGVLNSLAVNAEVVRARAARTDELASSVKTFADTVASQAEALMALNAAMLGLGRTGTSPIDVAASVRWMHTLLARSARADGRRFDLVEPLSSLDTTDAPANAVRLAAGAALLAAAEQSPDVTCRAEEGDGAHLVLETGDTAVALDPFVTAALSEVEIVVVPGPSALTISFPRRDATRTPFTLL